MTDPRRTYKAERLRARVFREETHCHLCKEYVDQTLPKEHPKSRTVDHLVPVSKGGNPYDRANCRLACRDCNARRGNGEVITFERTRGVSRDW